MKAIVLAAGKGKRLRGIINDVPKPMVKIGDKPVLQRNIEWLKSFGIEDVYINLHCLPDVIRDYFGNGSSWGIKITYSCEQQLLGTAGAVQKIASEYWKDGDTEAFLVIYGDNLLSDFDLNRIIDFHKMKRGIGAICLYRKDEVAQGGIAVMDDESRIVKFIEKPSPDEFISNLVNTGIYVLEPGILEYIPRNRFSDFGKSVFGEVIDAGENLYGIVSQANLVAIDTPELFEKAVGDRTEK